MSNTHIGILVGLVALGIGVFFYFAPPAIAPDVTPPDPAANADNDSASDPVEPPGGDTPPSVVPSAGGVDIPEAALLAVTAVQASVATEVGVPESTVVITGVEEATWPNGCLGLAADDEMCTQALVPGYEVTVAVNGTTRVFRTNIAGTVIREDT